MAASHRAPKQWCLTKDETVNSFENWKQNLQYILSLDLKFAKFLGEGVTWEKKSRSSPKRGFNDDKSSDNDAERQSATQKVATLELMLGQIANYCPIIARNAIVKNSTSLTEIWQLIRLHYGFQSTGAHFLDFSEIKLDAGEKPEDLYQRINAFVEDNLLLKDSNIEHHGSSPDEDEELSPTMENFIVLTWLRLINSELPRLVKQRYGTELRSKTLASIKPEISLAMSSLLSELQATEETQVMRTNFQREGPRRGNNVSNSQRLVKRPTGVSCPLCHEAGRQEDHFLSKCPRLPESDRKYISKARAIGNIADAEDSCATDDEQESSPSKLGKLRRVQVEQSPYLNLYHRHIPIQVTLDSGATGNMISETAASRLNMNIVNTRQVANQADGRSPLSVIGEVKSTLSLDKQLFSFEALVVEHLDVDILGGMPFMKANDIHIRPAKNEVHIGDNVSFKYGLGGNNKYIIRRTQASLLRAEKSCTIWPGDVMHMKIPAEWQEEKEMLLTPRTDAIVLDANMRVWPDADVLPIVDGQIQLTNIATCPISVKRGQHIAQVSAVRPVDIRDSYKESYPAASQDISDDSQRYNVISVDPNDILSSQMKSEFCALHKEMADVFRASYKGYNGYSGPIQGIINMSPVQPPQRKGRIPQYSRDRLVELQAKFDELEQLGVFKVP